MEVICEITPSISSGCGGVVLCSFCRPIRAMSLLKSPHSMCMWLGCIAVCYKCHICCIIGMHFMSLVCDGMYKCIINHGCTGWLFIFITCRLGKMRFLLKYGF